MGGTMDIETNDSDAVNVHTSVSETGEHLGALGGRMEPNEKLLEAMPEQYKTAASLKGDRPWNPEESQAHEFEDLQQKDAKEQYARCCVPPLTPAA
jgi:hypothetical protein